METFHFSIAGTLVAMLHPISFTATVAVATVASRSTRAWRLTMLAIGAAAAAIIASVLFAAVKALDGAPFQMRGADYVAGSVAQIMVASWIVRWWRTRRSSLREPRVE
jgi:hypothetical protein